MQLSTTVFCYLLSVTSNNLEVVSCINKHYTLLHSISVSFSVINLHVSFAVMKFTELRTDVSPQCFPFSKWFRTNFINMLQRVDKLYSLRMWDYSKWYLFTTEYLKIFYIIIYTSLYCVSFTNSKCNNSLAIIRLQFLISTH